MDEIKLPNKTIDEPIRRAIVTLTEQLKTAVSPKRIQKLQYRIKQWEIVLQQLKMEGIINE